MKLGLFKLTSFVFFIGMQSLNAQQSENLVDVRDSKVYKTVKINSQVWMAENLNFEIEKSATFENLPDNGLKYGRLYTWDAANNACPAGWHLPSDDEWKELEKYLGMSLTELEKIDSWRGTNQSTQLISDSTLGFNILLAGYKNPPSNFYLKDSQAFFWTSSFQNESAWFRQFYIKSPQIFRRARPKSWSFSVRCVKN